MSGYGEADRTKRLSVAHRTVDGICVVTLRGEIDHTAKDVLRDALIQHEAGTPSRVVADMSGVSFLDSSGINVLIFAHQHLNDVRGWLHIAAAQESVQRVLSLVGVDAVVPCRPTLEQALNT
ncbi:STAS domain-containing protein [Streptomyces sp. NPDC088752]|uniref:STAS domain-containing protein n=1 Tax=Streptomyces sp. NPDC088752 TaxID=3154963 RepID=UPI0034322FB1